MLNEWFLVKWKLNEQNQSINQIFVTNKHLKQTLTVYQPNATQFNLQRHWPHPNLMSLRGKPHVFVIFTAERCVNSLNQPKIWRAILFSITNKVIKKIIIRYQVGEVVWKITTMILIGANRLDRRITYVSTLCVNVHWWRPPLLNFSPWGTE